ncbi:MAG TPA: TonB-dependent receptor [Chitinophagaceae bacterium]|jgi:TonB-linked SusC/RagA family outer membrane protein|nr:TonB-dependent receptor [Chitinophagaceae bacterium]
MKNYKLFSLFAYPFGKKGLPKILLFISFLGLLCTTPARAKTVEGVLDQRITLIVENKEVRVVLNEITKLVEVKFIYCAQRIPAKKKVTIFANDKRVGDILNTLLGPLDVLYYVSGNQVVLMKKGEEADVLLKLKDQQEEKEITREVFYKTITGKVTNDKGEPLDGVSVTVKGTSRGTTTNSSGAFSIDAEVGETLEFSMVGFQPHSLQVGANNTVAIELLPIVASINEVVVVGYGTQKRANVTGAVSSVTGKTLNEVPVVSVQQALQGRVAGVQVTNNGSPGTQPIVRIRGISSISFASDPLYIVDGFPTGDLSTIDTRDIETVDVLKDASASAIYGSRATNGVIIITTKKGRRDGKVHVNLDSYVGTSKVTERIDLLNTQQFMQYALAYRGSQVQRLTPPMINEPIYPGATQTYGQTNTDWQDAYFKTGTITQHNIGLSGGNDISRFYASGGFMDQNGTTPKVGYRRYNFRINSDHVISKVFTFGENLYAAHGDQAFDNNETGSRSNLVNVIRMFPHLPVYDPTSIGGYRGAHSVLDGGDPTNPVEDAALKNPGNRKTTKILGTAFLEINLTKWLKFRSTFGVDYANGLSYSFSPIFNDNGNINGSKADQATITNNRTVSTQLLYTEQLTFDKTFGDHHINAIAVFEQQNQEINTSQQSGKQPSNDLRTLLNALSPSSSTRFDENSIMSVLGRINYDFKGKYLISGAIRRDGLSVWAPGKKWATFPSGSIGWRIDQEDFIQNIQQISELKLRAGYGVTGLNGVVLGSTPWLVSVAANSSLYPFNNTPNSGPGSVIPGIGTPDLEWEKTKQFNVGLDIGLFKNKFTLTAEYYKRTTDNLILDVPMPPSFGFINATYKKNVAGMENKGFELQLGYNDREGDFKWNATANFARTKNKVTELAPGVTNIVAGRDQDFGDNDITNTAPGQPIQSFYGWIVDGIFQSMTEVNSSAKQKVPAPGETYDPTKHTAPGDLKFRDTNKDGVIDDKDRVFLGSYLPDFTYALTAGANYKNFDASVFFQGVQGSKIFNATRVITEGMVRFFNAGTAVLRAWTPSNKNTDIPRAISSDPNQNARPSTRFLENGSYLRLKNVMIGYTIPSESLQSLTKGVVTSFRIYASAQNIFTITDYSGFDPEVGNRTPFGNNIALTNGIDFAVYPQPKSYTIGIQASF